MAKGSKTLRQSENDFETGMDADALERAAEVLKDKARLKKAKTLLAKKVEKARSAMNNIDGLRSK